MKQHIGALCKNSFPMAAEMHQADARDHLMHPPLQSGDHRPRPDLVVRLAENLIINKHQRVGPDDERVGNFFSHDPRLAMGIKLANFQRGKVFVSEFCNGGGKNMEFNRQKFQQLRTTWRS